MPTNRRRRSRRRVSVSEEMKELDRQECVEAKPAILAEVLACLPEEKEIGGCDGVPSVEQQQDIGNNQAIQTVRERIEKLFGEKKGGGT